MEHKKGYRKSTKGGAGVHGIDYQINILILFLLEAYKNGEDFRLSTENDKAGKFDDVVLETTKTTILLQAKHKMDPKKSLIKYNDIFPSGKNKNEFNIFKYIESFADIKNNFNNLDTLILCTNTDLTNDIKQIFTEKTMLDSHIFSFTDRKCYYTFNKQCKDLNCSLFKKDIIDLFSQKFQLISVSDRDINIRIRALVRDIDIFDDLDQSVNFLKDIVKLCFENEKGTYLTRSQVDTVRSAFFIKKLESYKVNFKIDSDLELPKYTCYCVKNKNNINIHLLKIYQQIKSYRVLLVPPFDNGVFKEKVIYSFCNGNYHYLIIVVFKEELSVLRDVIRKIVEQVSGKSYKRFIFVSDDADILGNFIENPEEQAHVFKETISFGQLTDETQKEIFSKNIIFQGKQITLYELLHPQTLEFDENILFKLINNDNINIFDYKNNINHYVTRSLRSETRNSKRIFTENDFCDVIVEDTDTILIIDGPGMGKTTLLSNLQKILIEKFNYLVIKINLNECTKIFKASLQKNKQIDLLELLYWNQFDDFEKLLFNLPKKVVILFDAFDEISPNYSELVLNLIKYCEGSKNVRKVVLTSREHCENNISRRLYTFLRFSLNPFSIEDQLNFLKNYWTKKLQLTNNEDTQRCEEFITKLLTKITNTIGKDSWNLIGVPLQSQMLAEIFKKECSEYITSNNFKAESLDKFNIAKLYEQFIKEKKNIYIDEKINVNSSISVSNILSEKFDRAIDEEHTKMALKVVFDKSEYKHFKILVQNKSKFKMFFKRSHKSEDSDVVSSMPNISEMGIVQMSGDSFQFIHRTFAEYLAAKYICNFFNQTRMEKSFSDFLISEVFSYRQYNMLRSFMNGILEDRSIPKKILKIFGKNNLPLRWHYNNLLNLAINRQFNLLEIMLKENRNCIFNETTRGRDLFSETLSNFSIFKILLDKGANIRKIYFDGITVLHLAAVYDSEEVIKYLINNNLDVYARDKKGNSPLHYAAANNSAKAVKILSKIVSNYIKNNFRKSALFSACERDAVDVLPILIQANFGINDRAYNNSTPFITACSYKSLRCINYLLVNGADITATDNEGSNGLHHLANIKDILDFKELYIETTNKILLTNCIDVNSKTNDGMTALHYASHADNVAMAFLLVNNKADIEIKNNEGATSFLLACSKKSLNCIKFLIEAGADLSTVDNKGRNALYCLAIPTDLYKYIDRKILNKSSMDIDKITGKIMSWIYPAIEEERDSYFQSLKSLTYCSAPAYVMLYSAVSTNLYEEYLDEDYEEDDEEEKDVCLYRYCSAASTDLYKDIMRKVLNESCIDINGITAERMTAMHLAIKGENLAMLEILLEHGADKEIKDKNGRTPFLLACSEQALDCLIYLLKNGADINETDNSGCNALHILANIKLNYGTHDPLINIFKELSDRNCINLNSVCGKGMTAMHHAVIEENLKVLKILLEHGADKEIKDKNGRTPFLLACCEQAFHCAIYLLENGANINETDITGCNAFHILSKLVNLTHIGTVFVTNLLKLNSINLDDVSNEGLTALQYASSFGNLEMTDLLTQNNYDVDNCGRRK